VDPKPIWHGASIAMRPRPTKPRVARDLRGPQRVRIQPEVHCVSALVMTWTLSALSVLSILGFVVWLACIILAACHRRSRLALLTCFVSPYAVAFFFALLSYASGTGRIMRTGHPPWTYALDRYTRAPPTTSGCIASGNEWVWQEPNNLALRMMATLFGPMPGSYQGPYPTAGEATDTLANAHGAILEDGSIEFAGTTVALSRELSSWAEDCLSDIAIPTDGHQFGLQAALTDSGVLVFGNATATVMVERETGRAFSYEGRFSCIDRPPGWRGQATDG